MKYILTDNQEGGRQTIYESLEQIQKQIEGCDWASGNYLVRDELGTEYEAEWIKKPKQRKFFWIFGIVDIGSYKLVPKSK